MENIRIGGIGLVNRAGITPEDFWKTICQGSTEEERPPLTAFSLAYPSSRLRRINRYCRMALYASQKAFEEAKIPETQDPFSVGTVFATGYGAMEAQVKFCRETAKGDPDFCSPTTFTGTVPNSCVGTVCMFLKCRGASTMLSGGNHLEYAGLLLENGQAEYILAGAVEEYCRELFEDLEACRGKEEVPLAEGCAVFCLKREDGGGYCSLKKTGTAGLPFFVPFACGREKEAETPVRELLEEYRKEKPDVIFGCGSPEAFSRVEQEIFQDIFPGVPVSGRVKKAAGETLGCGFSMNVAAAALCLSHGYVPEKMLPQGTDLAAERILVTGYDAAGNYLCALLCS